MSQKKGLSPCCIAGIVIGVLILIILCIILGVTLSGSDSKSENGGPCSTSGVPGSTSGVPGSTSGVPGSTSAKAGATTGCACFNTWDIQHSEEISAGTEIDCDGIIAQGISCEDKFCPTCPDAHYCDKSCGFC